VATVWRELLSIERIAVTDNFLDLGGHSLLIMQAIVGAGRAGLEVTIPALGRE